MFQISLFFKMSSQACFFAKPPGVCQNSGGFWSFKTYLSVDSCTSCISLKHQFRPRAACGAELLGAFCFCTQPRFNPTHVNTDCWGNQITATSYNHTNQIISLIWLLTVSMQQFLFKQWCREMYDICRANVDALPDFQNIGRFMNSFTDKTPAPQVQDPGKQVFNLKFCELR